MPKSTSPTKKVCILSESLAYGGAERYSGLLSKALVQKGMEVFVVILINKVDYPYQGKLINLGKGFGNGFLDKIKKYKKLQEHLKKEQFDFVLDNRMKNFGLREVLLNILLFKNNKTINIIHSSKLDFYFPNPKWLSKIFYNKYAGNIAVSKELAKKIRKEYNFTNIATIPSPIDLAEIAKESKGKNTLEKPYIVAAGRMDDDIKQFGKLISLFSGNRILKELDLVILGEGKRRKELKALIDEKGMSAKIHLIGFVPDPFPYYQKAKFYVLCSKFEGFPMVLIESLACGTPVVSFDCETGPREIVETGINGILVENQDFEALGAAMEKMQENNDFYGNCKRNARKSVENFNIKKVGADWQSYLEIK